MQCINKVQLQSMGVTVTVSPVFQVSWSIISDDSVASAGLGRASTDMFSAEKQNAWISISVRAFL